MTLYVKAYNLGSLGKYNGNYQLYTKHNLLLTFSVSVNV